jgi:dihydroorotate dehydrogenase (NAD+) catalytic subunit
VKRKRLVITARRGPPPHPAGRSLAPARRTRDEREARPGEEPAAVGMSAGPDVDLSVDLAPCREAGLRLAHPVLVAAGGASFGLELLAESGASLPAAIVTAGVTRAAQRGNPPPRMVALPGGLLSSVGPQNPGAERALSRYATRWGASEVPVIVNLCAESAEDLGALASVLDGRSEVAGLEVNLACGERRYGGLPFGLSPDATRRAVGAVRGATALPVIAKLTPAAEDARAVALAAVEAGADAISATGSMPGLAIDRARRQPALGSTYGGLSGPGLKPVALRVVHDIAQVVRVPIVGVGGVARLEDVLDYLMAGASAVALATAALADPGLPGRLGRELEGWCRDEGLGSHRDIVGAALPARRSRVPALAAGYRLARS